MDWPFGIISLGLVLGHVVLWVHFPYYIIIRELFKGKIITFCKKYFFYKIDYFLLMIYDNKKYCNVCDKKDGGDNINDVYYNNKIMVIVIIIIVFMIVIVVV